jgi:hypothetical protein
MTTEARVWQAEIVRLMLDTFRVTEQTPHRHVWHVEQQTGHTYCSYPDCRAHKNGEACA